MTRFITVRTLGKGGPVCPATVIEWNGPLGAKDPGFKAVQNAKVVADVNGHDVVLAIHGFNVSRTKGAHSFRGLEAALDLPPGFHFFGVLWPGDFWIPVINYPWEAGDAVQAGREIALYLNRYFIGANSISIISHSLGGRALLETVKNLDLPAGQLCITAGAVDGDCLDGQYQNVRGNAARIAVLSSTRDKVLRLAYPAGDLVSDVLLGDNDNPWRSALGLKGPKRPVTKPVFSQPIPADAGTDRKGYDHGDYFPPGDFDGSLPADSKWVQAARYMRRIVTTQPTYWP